MAKGACVMKGECILVWLEFCECGGKLLGSGGKRDDESQK